MVHGLSMQALIDGQVLCVHGGLSPDLRTLDQVCSVSVLCWLGLAWLGNVCISLGCSCHFSNECISLACTTISLIVIHVLGNTFLKAGDAAVWADSPHDA